MNRSSKRLMNFSLAGILSLTLLGAGGCQSSGGPDNAATGALLGAGLGAAAGAIIGNQSGSAGEGAGIGAAAGGLLGYIFGNEADKNEARYYNPNYDY